MSLSIGQSAGYINNIENGVNLPSMMTFFYICEYLGVEPKDFFDTKSTNPTKANELFEIAKSLNNEQLDNLIAIAKDIKSKIHTLVQKIKMPPTKGGIFSNIVGYHSRVSHNDRQDTDLLLHYHLSYLQLYRQFRSPLSERYPYGRIVRLAVLTNRRENPNQRR